MKTFEEKWTAWIDGELNGEELSEFEAALPHKVAAEVEKQDALKLGGFLKAQLQITQPMGNEDFFNHQLRERIARDEDSDVEHEEEEAPAASPVWWTIRRLLWTGATSLALFAVCTFFVIRQEKPSSESSPYLTQILNTRLDPAVSPNATVSIFQTKEDKVTVLWVDGLQSLPSEFAAK